MKKMTKEKLEILVVEDTLENMKIAKQYFDSVENIGADYATHRDEAISMLDQKKYDGVITDRSIPGKKNLNLHPWYLENNGWYVAISSEIKNIPSVIHSEHGTCNYFILAKDQLIKNLEDNKNHIEKGFSILKKSQYENQIGQINWFRDIQPGLEKLKMSYGDRKHLTKKDPESWEVALDYLKDKIESK